VCVCVCVCVCVVVFEIDDVIGRTLVKKTLNIILTLFTHEGEKSHRQQERSPWTVIRKLQLIRR